MVKLFFSYSHRDESLRDELEMHLSILKRQGVIDTWHDRRIIAGEDFGGEISEHLETADIVLLLVSVYFLDSDYCYDVEMNRALERNEAGDAHVVPVILRPCDWKESRFGGLLAIPTDGKPVSKFAEPHDAFLEITQAIRRIAKEELGQVADQRAVTHEVIERVGETTIVEESRSSNLRVRRKFTDSERDRFVEECYEYLCKFFESSLKELAARNTKIETNFRKVDANHFTAVVYRSGRTESECRIWLGPGIGRGARHIFYSCDLSAGDGAYHVSLLATDDGHTFLMRTEMAMAYDGRDNSQLSIHGAAEYLWSRLIEPLQ